MAFFMQRKDSINMTEAEKEKYKAYDRMMRAVPNMKPRYSGIMIPPTPETELSIRIRDGTAARDEVLSETFKSIRRKDFKTRLTHYLSESEDTDMSYRNNCHRRAFHSSIHKRDTENYALLSALYLLTANYDLWRCTRDYVVDNIICFEQISLQNCTEDQYALYCAAKDLYLGTKHKTFAAICNANSSTHLFLFCCIVGLVQSLHREIAEIK